MVPINISIEKESEVCVGITWPCCGDYKESSPLARVQVLFIVRRDRSGTVWGHLTSHFTPEWSAEHGDTWLGGELSTEKREGGWYQCGGRPGNGPSVRKVGQ